MPVLVDSDLSEKKEKKMGLCVERPKGVRRTASKYYITFILDRTTYARFIHTAGSQRTTHSIILFYYGAELSPEQ